MAVDLYFEEENEQFYLDLITTLCDEMKVEVIGSVKTRPIKDSHAYKVKFAAQLEVLQEFLPKYIERVGTVPVDAVCDGRREFDLMMTLDISYYYQKRVMLMGTFDPLHDGHRHYFATARESGDELYVLVMPDHFVRNFKGREPMYDQGARLEAVLTESIVDRAAIVSADEQEKVEFVVGLKPDIYYFGAATYDNEWNSNFQRILRERLPDVEFRVTTELDRERLSSTRIRGEM
jgi:cytidyltransferase-like protein